MIEAMKEGEARCVLQIPVPGGWARVILFGETTETAVPAIIEALKSQQAGGIRAAWPVCCDSCGQKTMTIKGLEVACANCYENLNT